MEYKELYSFGRHPITNRFQNSPDTVAPCYPLTLYIDRETGLVRLSEYFPITELRPHYPWLTCFEPDGHLDDLVKLIIDLPGIDYSSIFAGFSFKDDSTLERLKNSGYNSSWRLFPNEDLETDDTLLGIESLVEKFCDMPASKLGENHEKADLLLVRHVLEHSRDLDKFIKNVTALVKSGGYVVFEVPDCERSFDVGDCTVLWEEHISYFTGHTLEAVLINAGLEIVCAYSVPYPLENSLIVFAKVNRRRVSRIQRNSFDLRSDVRRLREFTALHSKRKLNINHLLRVVKEEYGSISMFGAGHLTFTFISLYELEEVIDFIIDDDPNKTNLFAPLGGIPIFNSEALYALGPRLCLLGTNPIKHTSVVSRHPEYLKKGGRFASIFPGTAGYLEDLFRDRHGSNFFGEGSIIG